MVLISGASLVPTIQYLKNPGPWEESTNRGAGWWGEAKDGAESSLKVKGWFSRSDPFAYYLLKQTRPGESTEVPPPPPCTSSASLHSGKACWTVLWFSSSEQDPRGKSRNVESNPLSTFNSHAFPHVKPHLLWKMNYSVNIPRDRVFSFLPFLLLSLFFSFGINRLCYWNWKSKVKIIREYSNIIYDVYRSGWKLGKRWKESKEGVNHSFSWQGTMLSYKEPVLSP